MTTPEPARAWQDEEALARLAYERLDLPAARRHALAALAGADELGAIWLRYRYLGDFDGVVALGERRLADHPAEVETLLQVGRAFHMMGRRHEALGFYMRVLEYVPAHPAALHAMGDLLLLMGDAAAGWRRMDSLVNESFMPTIDPRLGADLGRYWRGQPLEGKRILVVHYLGIGDNLMMARFARDLQARGAHVTFACHPALYRLLQGMAGVDELRNSFLQEPWSNFDYWTFDYLTPRWLGAAEGQIPAYPDGYAPRPTPRPTARIPGRLRVGLCWSSGTDHFTGAARFLAAEDFRPLAALTHIDWFVLQKTPDNQTFAARSGLKVQDLSPGWVDLLDTAGLMTSLDLTVSICSAPLHLAGALGLTAWGLISAAPDWRWGERGETSPWYPTLRLFRQETLFDWEPVMSRLKSALAAYPVARGEPK